MIIERVKKGQKIEADKINSIIEVCNKRYDVNTLMEGSSSFSMPQGGSNSYREWPPMWSCKANDGQGSLTIRGGIVVVLDTNEPCRNEITVNETEISSNGGSVYVSVDINNLTAVITTEEADGAENILIGNIIDNGKGFNVYKQLSRAELYVSKVISLIAGDGIEIVEESDNKNRIVTVSTNFSFIGKDGIEVKDYSMTDLDGTSKRIVEIGGSAIGKDFSFISEDDIKVDVYPDPNDPSITTVKIGNKQISFIAADNISIDETSDTDYRYVTISASPIDADYISFCSGDNITITETSITGGRRVEISANIPSVIVPDFSFIAEDQITINEEVSTDNSNVRIIRIGFSKVDGDQLEFDPVFFSVNDGVVSFNIEALDGLIAEAVNELTVDVVATGVYRNVSGHGDLYYNAVTTTSAVDALTLDSEITYTNPNA